MPPGRGEVVLIASAAALANVMLKERLADFPVASVTVT